MKTSKVEQSGANYQDKRTICERFLYRAKWMEFELSLPDEERKDMFISVMQYGFHKKTPANLSRRCKIYFNKYIKHDIDRQHKRMEKGLKPW